MKTIATGYYEVRPTIDKRATQSYESRVDQEAAAKQSLRLSAKEIECLEYLWRGYASELGCKSLHGATENRLLRSPPKNTARPLVLAELERAGGRAPEGAVLRILAAEGCTRYETRQAIHWLLQGGAIERTPVDPMVVDKDGKLTKGAHESTAHELRLAAPPAVRLALVRVPVPPEERQRRRWQSQDDALEAWHQTLVCGDSAEAPVMTELADSKLRRTVPATLAALRAIAPVHALVLRKTYGDVDPSARAGVFGRELAPIATMTRVVEHRRQEAETMAGYTVDACSVVRDALDNAPQGKDAKAKWSVARTAFVAKVRSEAEQLLIAASAAYRAARRGT